MLSFEFLKVAILNEVRQNLKIVLIFIFMAKDAGAFNGYQTLIFFVLGVLLCSRTHFY